jgi:hypothetical protein
MPLLPGEMLRLSHLSSTARLVGSHRERPVDPNCPPGLYPKAAPLPTRPSPHRECSRAGHMSCLAASAATPPAARPASQRLFLAVATPSPWRSFEPHRALLWRREGAGPRAVTMLRQCSSAGDSRAAGDGSLSRLLYLCPLILLFLV